MLENQTSNTVVLPLIFHPSVEEGPHRDRLFHALRAQSVESGWVITPSENSICFHHININRANPIQTFPSDSVANIDEFLGLLDCEEASLAYQENQSVIVRDLTAEHLQVISSLTGQENAVIISNSLHDESASLASDFTAASITSVAASSITAEKTVATPPKNVPAYIKQFVAAINAFLQLNQSQILRADPDFERKDIDAIIRLVEAYGLFINNLLRDVLTELQLYPNSRYDFYSNKLFTLATREKEVVDIQAHLLEILGFSASEPTLLQKFKGVKQVIKDLLPLKEAQIILQGIYELQRVVPQKNVELAANLTRKCVKTVIDFNSELRDGCNYFVDFLLTHIRSENHITIRESSLPNAKEKSLLRPVYAECKEYRDYLKEGLTSSYYDLALLSTVNQGELESNKLYIEFTDDSIRYTVKKSSESIKQLKGSSLCSIPNAITNEIKFSNLGIDPSFKPTALWQLRPYLPAILAEVVTTPVILTPKIEKLNRIQALLDILEEPEITAKDKLSLFRREYVKSKECLSKHRDSRGVLFLKELGMIASSLFFGAGIIYFESTRGSPNFFKARGKIFTDHIDADLQLNDLSASGANSLINK